ncbi:MAG: glycosyltransferase family 2 protein, partial [Pseudomonadota bacterium]
QFINRPVQKKPGFFPKVSVVIAAHNESTNIEKRLENLCTQDYPLTQLEIVIASDGSTDDTNLLVEQFVTQNETPATIRLVALETNQGKPSALNSGVAAATGEIIVMADARQQFADNVISTLVANFADDSIACVSGELVFYDDPDSRIEAEMGLYWSYEKWIRKAEAQIDSVVGATGAIYAVRTNCFSPIDSTTLLDDVLIPMRTVLNGRRVIFEEDALAYDIVSADIQQEWRRKVRTLAGNWQLLNLEPALMLPWRNRLWWQFMSHKISRVIVPFALIALLLSSILLTGPFYQAIMLAQFAFYAVAALGAIWPAAQKNRLINLCYFFVVLNLAAAQGFWVWISGRSSRIWQPAYKKA